MFFDAPKDKTIKLKPYEPRPLTPLNLMSVEELQSQTADILFVDIEIYPNYFLAAFTNYRTKKQFIFELSAEVTYDRYMISWILMSYKTVGFNSLKFDLPLLWLAYRYHSIEILFEATQLLISGERPYDLAKRYDFKIYKTDHIDLIEVCPLTGSLKTYSARLHAKRLQDLPFDPLIPLSREKALVLRDYCLHSDIPNTMLIWDNLQEQLELRKNLSIQYNTNLMSKSDAQIAEAVIASELRKLTNREIVRPKLDENYVHIYSVPTFIRFQTTLMQDVLETVGNAKYTLENGSPKVPKSISDLDIRIGSSIYRMGNGGLHSSESKVNYQSSRTDVLCDRDVASYYPAIVLNNSFYPKHLGLDFLTVYKALVERRLEAKKNKQTAIADALKITINGAFGKLGSPYSILYSPDLLIQVTVTGQLSLLMLIEGLELVGIPVVSANTDGIVIKCPVDRQEAMLETIRAWEARTGFVTEETRYVALYSRDCNGYLAIKPDGTVKGKGPYGDPWSGGAKEAIWRFHRNPQTTICIEAAIAHITKGYDIESYILNCRDFTKFVSVRQVKGGGAWKETYLGKVVRWYYAVGEFGTINYATNGNKVAGTDGARPCMDLPDEMPTGIDYAWYVRKTIDILEELTYLNKPSKQLTFFG